jgi:hypothetical protein
MDIESEGDEVIDHILNLLLARSGLHHDNHALSSDFFRREKRRDDFVNARKLLMPMAFALDNRLQPPTTRLFMVIGLRVVAHHGALD